MYRVGSQQYSGQALYPFILEGSGTSYDAKPFNRAPHGGNSGNIAADSALLAV